MKTSGMRARRLKERNSLLAQGEPVLGLTAGALVVCLAMIAGLLTLVIYEGGATFWPGPAVEVTLVDGKTHYLGEVIRKETYRPEPGAFATLPADRRAEAESQVAANGGVSTRRLFRTGNFELTQVHHHWVSDFGTASETRPPWALVVERLNNDGRFYGILKAFRVDGNELADTPAEAWQEFHKTYPSVARRVNEIEKIREDDIGAVSRKEEAARLALRQAQLDHGVDSAQYIRAKEKLGEVDAWGAKEHERLNDAITILTRENARYELVLTTADGRTKIMQLADVARAYPANQLIFWGKLGVYLSRWWEFLSAAPRNRNSEGGVFPAIWGTAAMTLVMTFLMVPFGVMAALYLREYARPGPIVSIVRIAVNNLAGVPSIVFGVFGFGFFCYIVGGSLDQWLFRAKLPTPTFGTGGLLWASLTLALLTLPVVIVATEEALAAVPLSMREGSFACGASKWQTIRRIILPRAMPGILTGMILAIARGAGEVAPLMLVGVLNKAPALPVDGVFPFIHLQRSFMHLGFHIYDVGFQSQDSESAKPMVFTTTLLLIALITILNLAAMRLRSRLRRRHSAGHF